MKDILAVLVVVFAFNSAVAAETKPNIIVFYTDDHGYADLGIHGVVNDIRTPHLDALARSGVVVRNGYSTAPQCVPSRGGLLTGKFQGRFNLDSNSSTLDGFNQETTIATRLQRAGYVTAQFGKWHLGPTPEITKHGFKHVYAQHGQQKFSANVTADGKDRPMSDLAPEMYHIDGCSRAAASVIERYQEQPFFLYVAYRARHTPLDAPSKYTERFPGPMPERRRQALAMLSAVDDGVGLVTDTLRKHGLTERTLIFFIGDNGAPLIFTRPTRRSRETRAAGTAASTRLSTAKKECWPKAGCTCRSLSLGPDKSPLTGPSIIPLRRLMSLRLPQGSRIWTSKREISTV